MTFDPSERDLQTLNTGREMRIESNLIFPMLEKQREAAISSLCNSFKMGQMEMLSVFTAQLVSIENMKSEIRQKIIKAENIERKIYKQGETFNGSGAV